MEIESGSASNTEAASTSEVSSGAESAQGAAETTGQGASGEARAGASGKAAAGAGVDGEASKSATTPSAFTPNFKFKVKDKDLEIDDFLKPVVKDAETEKKLRELYEKAHGLDEVKGSRDTFKTEAEQWKGRFSNVETSLKTLGEYVKKDDFRSFFEALNIPKDKIIQYAINELKYQELPAEQRAAIEAQREQQFAYEQSSVQNQTLQKQMADLVQKQAAFELDQELAKPEIVQAAQSFDTRTGKAGEFRKLVIQRGQYYEAVHKISPPASQLAQEVVQLIGVQATAQPGTAPSQNQSSPTGSQTQAAKPVIPSFSGGGKSPVKKMPTSIDDLRALRQNLTT